MGIAPSFICPKRLAQSNAVDLEDGTADPLKLAEAQGADVVSKTETGTTFRVEYTPPAWMCQSTVQALQKLQELPYDSQDPWRASFGKDSQKPKGKLTAASQHSRPALADGHPNGFVNAAVTAFAYHYPISLSPDHFWLLILQAVSKHVEQNSEELRGRFVHHEGKQTLLVDNDFILGSSENDWSGEVQKFSQQINNILLPGVAERLSGGFSTTGPTEDIAAKVTVMEICKSYVDFMTRTKCGIPVVTLEGTPNDWKCLRCKAEGLIRLQCLEEFAEWWLPSLLPVLDKVADSAEGSIDKCFWQSFVKRGSTHGSGAHSFVSGWINCLFPFQGNGKRNFWCTAYTVDSEWARYARGDPIPLSSGADKHFGKAYGADEESFPPGLSKAAVTWNYLGTHIPMTFVSGFFAASQHPSSWVVRPEVGWAIFELGDTNQ